ncbi:MAG TPA: NYN domain-containing protein [Ferrovibrio sp.]|uniref:NYN domain-containing protein n=1 Tax=Ferrovibrio sp. TaxID=1917215 RepID=UPI002ED56AB2
MKAWVYIDGFNLYYGCLKNSRYKWLNLKKLAESALPQNFKIRKVKYFTARVSGAVDPQAPARQQVYLNALKTVPEIEVHFGHFLAKTQWRPLINLPVAARTIRSGTPVILPAGTHTVDGTPNQSLPVGSYAAKGAPRRRRTPVPAPDALVTEIHTMEEKGSDVNLAAHLT